MSILLDILISLMYEMQSVSTQYCKLWCITKCDLAFLYKHKNCLLSKATFRLLCFVVHSKYGSDVLRIPNHLIAFQNCVINKCEILPKPINFPACPPKKNNTIGHTVSCQKWPIVTFE